ncbi:hypothetical protein D3C71_2128170 [compost metagenome]
MMPSTSMASMPMVYMQSSASTRSWAAGPLSRRYSAQVMARTSRNSARVSAQTK